MDWRKMAKKAEGLHTLEGFASLMNIHKKTAAVYLHLMRKEGYVKTSRGKRGKRLYEISPLQLRPVGSKGFFEVLNENSSIGIQFPYVQKVYGRDVRAEEVIIWALLTKDYRVVLASLELFRKVGDFSLLYRLAKHERLERHVGALYALARKFFRLPRIDGRILKSMMRAPLKKKYIIPPMKSSDFADIQHKWGVFIPFSMSDFDRLRR
ncbi:MAG: hypothetical protein HYX24_05075 [Candidatus Aenigmarchaeota archaeon]|nr:hypothetical protein [Candidatus Aenigmarchaeota archaeon]